MYRDVLLAVLEEGVVQVERVDRLAVPQRFACEV